MCKHAILAQKLLCCSIYMLAHVLPPKPIEYAVVTAGVMDVTHVKVMAGICR